MTRPKYKQQAVQNESFNGNQLTIVMHIMTQEKKKKQLERLGTFAFVGHWTRAYALAWMLLVVGGLIILTVLPFAMMSVLPPALFFFVGAGFIGLTTGLAQQRLIERNFKQLLTGWWWKSTLAWAITGFLWYGVLNSDFMLNTVFTRLEVVLGTAAGVAFFFALLLVPPALVQSWLIRKQIKHAWLWPVAALASAAPFALPIALFLADGTYNAALLAAVMGGSGLIQGAVMGMVMLYLLNLTQPAEAVMEAARQSTAILQHLATDPQENLILDDAALAFEHQKEVFR